MSGGGSGRRRPYVLSVVLACLVPAAIAGWLLWHSGGDEPSGARPSQPAGESAEDVRGGEDSKGGESASPKASGSSTAQREPLRGKTVLLDPGHNPLNRHHPRQISRSVDIGTGHKECDTTGTETNSGYSEAEFTLDLADRVREQLEAKGATVKLTHNGKRPYGPCVDERAEKGNRAGADAAVSLHADGAATGDRGFHVILPAPVQEGEANTTKIATSSKQLGNDLLTAFERETGDSPANYLGDGTGLDVRDDLGGLNLSKVPKVFLECGNMRDPEDAERLTDPEWRERAARGVADGIGAFVAGKR